MKFKFLALVALTLLILGARGDTNVTATTNATATANATNATVTANTTVNATSNATSNTSTTTNSTSNATTTNTTSNATTNGTTTTNTTNATNTTAGAQTSTNGTVTIDASTAKNCTNPLYTAAAFQYYGITRPKYLTVPAVGTGLKICKGFEGISSCCDVSTTTDISSIYAAWKANISAILTSNARSLKIAFNSFLLINTLNNPYSTQLTIAIKARLVNLQYFMVQVNKDIAACAQASFQNAAEFLCFGCHPTWGKYMKGTSLMISNNTCAALANSCYPLISDLGRLKNISRIADRDMVDIIAMYTGIQADPIGTAVNVSVLTNASSLARRRYRVLQTTNTTTNSTINSTANGTTTNTTGNGTLGSDACAILTAIASGNLTSCAICWNASSATQCATNQFLNVSITSWPADRRVVPIIAFYKNDANTSRYRTWMILNASTETSLHQEYTLLIAAAKPAAALTALYLRLAPIEATLVAQAKNLAKQQAAVTSVYTGTNATGSTAGAGSTSVTPSLVSATTLRTLPVVVAFETKYATLIAAIAYDVRSAGGIFTCTANVSCILCFDTAKNNCSKTTSTWNQTATVVLNCSQGTCTECIANTTNFTCLAFSMPNPTGMTVVAAANDSVTATYASQAYVPASRSYSNGTGLTVPAEVQLPTNIFNISYFKYTAPCNDLASCQTWLCKSMFKGPFINADKLINPQDSNASLWGQASVATSTGRRFLVERNLADSSVSANTVDSSGIDYSAGSMSSGADTNATIDGVTPTTNSATAVAAIGDTFPQSAYFGAATNTTTDTTNNNAAGTGGSSANILQVVGTIFSLAIFSLIA